MPFYTTDANGLPFVVLQAADEAAAIKVLDKLRIMRVRCRRRCVRSLVY
jgi:hypothetical protein